MPVTVFDFSSMGDELTPAQVATCSQAAQEEQQRRQDWHNSLKFQYRMHPKQPFVTLNNGRDMPRMGLGTWKSAPGEVQTAVEAALRGGYRHIDCAHVYQNESEVGRGLDTIFQEGAVTRQEVFICSKLWNNDHATKRVRAACLVTLKALQLKYLDLYLIHWPVTGVAGQALSPSLEETWKAMEALVDEGLVLSIGVSNCSAVKIQSILDMARIKPAVNQVEAHPYFTNETLLQWCRMKGIALTAYSPLGSPDSAAELKRDSTLNLLGDPVVMRIAEAHGKEPGQVLIRWGLQRGTAVLPKSSRPARIVSNLNVLDWSLSGKDMSALSNLGIQQRMVDGSFWMQPGGPYKVVEDLWDDEKMAGQAISDRYRLDLELPTATLNTGALIPLIGLGTWNSAPGEVAAAVDAALKCGYRHIDCASVYNNEEEVGKAFTKVWKGGVVSRESVFITSKLWNNNHAADKVGPALKKTLKELQLEYLDLYLVHWPATGVAGPTLTPSMEETWREMEKLVDQGLVRAIGMSNFSIVKMKQLLAYARIRPAVLQVEAHPYFNNAELLSWCKSEGIHFTGYAPLGSPGSATVMRRSFTPDLLGDPVVKEIAAAHKKETGQVLIRWGVQRGCSVLPKSTKVLRIASNLDVMEWSLTEEDMQKLGALGPQMRMVDGNMFLNPQGPYKALQDLWDDPTGLA